MARQRDSKLVGTIGNLIFYNRLGEYCMRTKPVDVRRTTASVHSGLNFGKASKTGKQIRNLVGSIYACRSDSLLINRLNGALNKYISWKEKMDAASRTIPRKLPFIYGFQFNDQADLSSITAIQPALQLKEPGLIEIGMAPFIPSQSIHAPANTIRIIFKMILMGINLNKAETELLGKAEIEIPNSSETFYPMDISIPAYVKPGNLTIMLLAVQYMVNKNDEIVMLNNKKKLPCGIVWANYM
jgi:hypothetical protein